MQCQIRSPWRNVELAYYLPENAKTPENIGFFACFRGFEDGAGRGGPSRNRRRLPGVSGRIDWHSWRWQAFLRAWRDFALREGVAPSPCILALLEGRA